MTGPSAIRRGLGIIYILSGLLHGAEMVFATLYSMGKIPLVVTARLWSQMYYAHFLFMVLAGGSFLALSYRRSGLFYPETLIDFLIGIGVFVILISLIGLALVRGLLNPWFSLVPSAFLAFYGYELLQGRRLGV